MKLLYLLVVKWRFIVGITANPKSTPKMKLASNEFLVRRYQCSQLKFPRCEGILSVTNRRILFYGYGRGSQIIHELPLDSVSGISSFYGRNLIIWRIVVMILAFAIIAYIYLSDSAWGIWGIVPFLLFLVGVYMIANCLRKTFHLQIYSSKASASPINIGEGDNGSFSNSAMHSIVAEPAEDTSRMMQELGAMIIDLQTLGDLGVDKWKE